MDKVLENIINKTIEREYDNIGENYIDNLKEFPELFKRDRELTQRMINALNQLSKALPKEYQYLVDEVDEISASMIGIECKFYFRKGLLLGLTELKYLSEVGDEIAYL